MTFYVAPSLVTGVREDAFAWFENDGRCVFCGATLIDGKYKPNQFIWSEYYALGENLGIGRTQRSLALIKNGQEVIVSDDVLDSRVSLSYYLHWGTKSQEWATGRLSDPHEWSSWHEIRDALEKTTWRNGYLDNLNEFQVAVAEWEYRTHQTLRQLELMLKQQGLLSPCDLEIYISEDRWLLHNCINGQITIGRGTNIEATITTSANGGKLLWGATPVSNGWLVALSHKDRFLLRQDGHNVTLQPMFFPRGGWKRYGQWTYWPRDSALLLPSGRIITIPTDSMVLGAGLEYALSVDQYSATSYRSPLVITLIDSSGNHQTIRLSQYGLEPKLFVGDKNVMIIHRAKGSSFYDISMVGLDQPPFRLKWRTTIFPHYADYNAYVIRGNPDVFVITYRMSSLDNLSVCLISASGKVWVPPINPNIPARGEKYFVTEIDNRVVIKLPDENGAPKGLSIIIEASGETGLVHLHPGITIRGNLVPFGQYDPQTPMAYLWQA